MRISSYLRLIFVLTALLGHGRAAGADILWYKDLKQASAVAQRSDLPMFIDFWADWCAACKVMDADVYTDATVIKAFESRIIGVRLHFDLQPDMARKFSVEALPYLIFTNSYGTPLMYHRGLLEAEDLTNVVNAMPPLAEINRLDRALQKNKNSFPDLLAMARALRESGFFETSNSYYTRASKQRAVNTDAAVRESIFYDIALNWLELEDGKQAASAFEKCLKDFPKSAQKPDVLLGLGRAYALDDNAEKARRALTSLINDYPQSPAAAQAQTLLKSP
jgi:thioredoxin-like negative regulator of GroEL